MIKEDLKRQRYGPTTGDVLQILRAVREQNREPNYLRATLEDIFTRIYQEGVDSGLAGSEMIAEFPEARL